MRSVAYRIARAQLRPKSIPSPSPVARIQRFAMSSSAETPAANPALHPVSSTANAHPANEAAQVAQKDQQQKPNGQKKEKKPKPQAQANSKLELSPPPEFFASRHVIFDKYKKIYDDKVAGKDCLDFCSLFSPLSSVACYPFSHAS